MIQPQDSIEIPHGKTQPHQKQPQVHHLINHIIFKSRDEQSGVNNNCNKMLASTKEQINNNNKDCVCCEAQRLSQFSFRSHSRGRIIAGNVSLWRICAA